MDSNLNNVLLSSTMHLASGLVRTSRTRSHGLPTRHRGTRGAKDPHSEPEAHARRQLVIPRVRTVLRDVLVRGAKSPGDFGMRARRA